MTQATLEMPPAATPGPPPAPVAPVTQPPAPAAAAAPAFWDEVEGTGFAKVGFFGFNKSGKSYTAGLLACAIRRFFKLDVPIALFDTENSAEYIVPLIKTLTGNKPLVKKATSFGQLVRWTEEVQKLGAIGLVDSITHPWTEFMDSWLRQKNEALVRANKRAVKRLEMFDIMAIKREWNARWADFFKKTPLHLIVCGRAGWDWDFEENEETGKKELRKTGVKMKTEGDFGFEPSLLIEMERNQDISGDHTRIVRVANILGDRFGVIDGEQFVFESVKKKPPTPKVILAACEKELTAVYNAFKPHLAMLSPGVHSDLSTEPTEILFDENGDAEWQREKRERTILAEEIQGEIVSAMPGQSAVEKKEKADILLQCFATRSWTAVENMHSKELRAGLAKLRGILLARLQAKNAAAAGESAEAVA
jgi:hypothetical protein